MITRKQLLNFIRGCFPKTPQEDEAYICADCVYGPGCQEFEQVSVPIRWLDDCREYLEREPRVLTLDEVLNGGDQLMWLQFKSYRTPEHYELHPTSPYPDNRPDGYSVSFQSGHVQIRNAYGKQWRCWTEKPSVADAMEWLPK